MKRIASAAITKVIPTAIAIIAGLIVLADFFLENRYLDSLGQTLVRWTVIVAAFALLLGLFNVLAVHGRRIWRREGGWPYSIVLLATALVVLVAGIYGPQAPSVAWVFQHVQLPLQATFFSLLAFFIATAAYRVFRARTPESTLLLLTGLIVLLGQAPVSQLLWDRLPVIKDWILAIPSTAGARGILLGAALGIVTTGLRVILGLDRQYSE
ncbi:MAG TPA: hypothetical protein EYP55_10080 [Anaerolineae bacterium]|nr:hypothetical protein [Anaerolineae bacterium]